MEAGRGRLPFVIHASKNLRAVSLSTGALKLPPVPGGRDGGGGLPLTVGDSAGAAAGAVAGASGGVGGEGAGRLAWTGGAPGGASGGAPAGASGLVGSPPPADWSSASSGVSS